MTEPTFTAPIETLRRTMLGATQRLLGDTIGLDDDAWQDDSRLPGWSRSHVATHLAAGADDLARVVENALDNPSAAPADDGDRRRRIELGSTMSGLELQIVLDTSAGRLDRALDAVEEWSAPVTLLGRTLTLAHVPMLRLSEVVTHHVDLDCGFEVTDVEPTTARWLLQWVLLLDADRDDLPGLQLQSISGTSGAVGGGGDRLITGTDADLWAWLRGRGAAEAVQGADGLELPLRS